MLTLGVFDPQGSQLHGHSWDSWPVPWLKRPSSSCGLAPIISVLIGHRWSSSRYHLTSWGSACAPWNPHLGLKLVTFPCKKALAETDFPIPPQWIWSRLKDFFKTLSCQGLRRLWRKSYPEQGKGMMQEGSPSKRNKDSYEWHIKAVLMRINWHFSAREEEKLETSMLGQMSWDTMKLRWHELRHYELRCYEAGKYCLGNKKVVAEPLSCFGTNLFQSYSLSFFLQDNDFSTTSHSRLS